MHARFAVAVVVTGGHRFCAVTPSCAAHIYRRSSAMSEMSTRLYGANPRDDDYFIVCPRFVIRFVLITLVAMNCIGISAPV